MNKPFFTRLVIFPCICALFVISSMFFAQDKTNEELTQWTQQADWKWQAEPAWWERRWDTNQSRPRLQYRTQQTLTRRWDFDLKALYSIRSVEPDHVWQISLYKYGVYEDYNEEPEDYLDLIVHINRKERSGKYAILVSAAWPMDCIPGTS